jgi:hypothetical protein
VKKNPCFRVSLTSDAVGLFYRAQYFPLVYSSLLFFPSFWFVLGIHNISRDGPSEYLTSHWVGQESLRLVSGLLVGGTR